jgi:hypothetical protein
MGVRLNWDMLGVLRWSLVEVVLRESGRGCGMASIEDDLAIRGEAAAEWFMVPECVRDLLMLMAKRRGVNRNRSSACASRGGMDCSL